MTNDIDGILIEINLKHRAIKIDKIIASNILDGAYKKILEVINNSQASESGNKDLTEFLSDVLKLNIQLLRKLKPKEEINNLFRKLYYNYTRFISNVNLKKISAVKFEIELINSIPSLLDKSEINSNKEIFKSFFDLINNQLESNPKTITDLKDNLLCLDSLIHFLDYFSNETTDSLLKILFQKINTKIVDNKIFQTDEIIHSVLNLLKTVKLPNILSKESKTEWINIIENQLLLCKNSENCNMGEIQASVPETPEINANRSHSDVKLFEKINDTLITPSIKEESENPALTSLKDSVAKQNFTLQDEYPNGRTTTASSFKQTTPKHELAKNIANENHPLEFASALGHGVLSGIINGSIQYFSNKNSASKQNNFTRLIIIYTGLLANATLAATFPVILSEIEKLYLGHNDEEAERLLNTLYTQALPTFFTSLGFSVALQLVKQCTQILNGRSRIKSFIENTIPVMGTAVSLFSKPLPALTQLATATATSSLTYFGLNKFFPIKQQPQFDTEANNAKVKYGAQNNDNGVELLQLLNEEKEANSNNIINGTQKKLTPEEIFFKKNKFISLESLNKITRYLKEIIDDTQNFLNIQNLQTSKELLQACLTALENCHAGLISKDFIKLPKDETPENVETQFKCNCESLKFLIESINKELQTKHHFGEDKHLKAALNKIVGLNSKDYTLEFKNKLGKIKDNIGFIDTIIKAALIKAAFLRNENVSNNNLQENRRYTTICPSSGSDGEARSSISGESEQSNTSGNSELDPIDPQQKTPFLYS